jgi:GT2 family glycosyltransferase
MTEISLIIVSYNVSELLLDCISSIKAETGRSFEVIVIDNNSMDDSVVLVKKHHPDVVCIANRENVGFASACNQGLAVAKGNYAVLLNPDTVVQEGALDKMFEYMEAHPEYGLCAPANYGPDGRLQYSCHHFPTLLNRITEYSQLRSVFPGVKLFGQANMTYWDYQDTRVVDWATGSCLMARMEMVNKVGMLDPNYFLYAEETDWCLRASNAGWPTVYYPLARIMHHSGASAGKGVEPEKMISKSIMNYAFQSQYYYFRKHKGRIYCWTIRAVDAAYAFLFYVKNMLWSGKQNRRVKLAKYANMIKLALGG